MISDETIRSDIREAFLSDDDVGGLSIGVDVREGLVFLDGAVPTYRRKLAAQEIAGTVDGVRGVMNGLLVEPPGRMGDGEVADHVRRALDSHADLEKETITVTCRTGKVTLSGHVRSKAERAIAQDVALCSKGVRDVRNLLVIDRRNEHEDKAISERIARSLRRTRGLRRADIRVAVSRDTVVLSGRVPDLAQKELAERVANRSPLLYVRNDIEVGAP